MGWGRTYYGVDEIQLISPCVFSGVACPKAQPTNKSFCHGLEKVKTLQNFVNSMDKPGGQQPPKKPTDLETIKESDGRSETIDTNKKDSLDISKPEIKRIFKPAPLNPFWVDPHRPDHPLLPIPRPPKTVEILSSDIVGICECLKRNGLQQDCPKRECRGKDLCLVWPSPRCQPSGLGAPIIVESRIKKPEVAQCEQTPSELALAGRKAAKERRKEEARLVECGREGWQSGLDQAKIDKELVNKYGYKKCIVHRNRYRIVPPMRDHATQTVEPSPPKEEIS